MSWHILSPVDETIDGDIDDLGEGEVDESRGRAQLTHKKRGCAGDDQFDTAVIQEALFAQGFMELGGGGFESQENAHGLWHGADRGGNGFEVLKDRERLRPEARGIGVEIFGGENMSGDGLELGAIGESASANVESLQKEGRGIDEGHGLTA